jgi:flavodoxin
MKFRKRSIIILIIFLIVVGSVAAFVLVQVKDRTYFHSAPYTPKLDKATDVLVVYYSRSGNTEAMAREIARKFDADIVKIKAERYTLDYQGWRNANNDADDKVTTTEIKPDIVDMSKYRLVFLGSPIWWYRPAPPLWAFVENNDFQGKNVVLFNTFNSRFKVEEVEAFQRKIEEKGGRLIDHLFIRRGRVYYQKSGRQLIQEVQTLLDEKTKEWQNIN